MFPNCRNLFPSLYIPKTAIFSFSTLSVMDNYKRAMKEKFFKNIFKGLSIKVKIYFYYKDCSFHDAMLFYGIYLVKL